MKLPTGVRRAAVMTMSVMDGFLVEIVALPLSHFKAGCYYNCGDAPCHVLRCIMI